MRMNGRSSFDFCNQRILVIGDFFIDSYIIGSASRLSPEAPVPIVKVYEKNNRPGGMGNVVNNLCSLGCPSRVLACLGTESPENQMLKEFSSKGQDISFILQSDGYTTIRKSRVVVKNQQLVRVDEEDLEQDYSDYFRQINSNLDKIFEGISGVLISDYGKGMVKEESIQPIISKAAELEIPVLVDPKGSDWDKYRGSTACTPNFSEFCEYLGKNLRPDDEEQIRIDGMEICKKLNLEEIILTRSERGMSTIDKDGIKKDYPADRVKEVIDVSGAGDTVISVMTVLMSMHQPLEVCCKMANASASVVISKFGTAPITIEEFLQVANVQPSTKIVPIEKISQVADRLHAQGKKVVFTNGCFDIIHCGHVESIRRARELGDVLILGLNSDASVRRLKGQERPINDENSRAKVLEAFQDIDIITIFDDDTPEGLIKAVRPDILVKGSDYADKPVVGREFVESYGGCVVLIDLVPGRSTTNIIGKIKSLDV